MKQRHFETTDLYLASAISTLLRAQPTFKVENSRTIFVFRLSDELYKAVNAYNGGVELNAYEFTQVIKRLRAEMFMRRNTEAQR